MSQLALVSKEGHPALPPGDGTPLPRRAGLVDRHLRIAPVHHGLVGATPVMRDLVQTIGTVGRTDVTVLVTGESGTGKALVARALHAESARRYRPFATLDCSAISAALVEQELFGYSRGAFAGAVQERSGQLEAAQGGTLFVDEIGDLGLTTQAALLRTLECGSVLRVGGSRATPVDVRVIAATTRPLEELVARGRFLQALLSRLQVTTLALPALRERRDDIPLLADHFLQRFSERHGVPVRPLSDGARALLLTHDWVGNVRELRHVIEGALLRCDGDTIMVADLPTRLMPSEAPSFVPDDAWAALTFVEARERALREFDRAFLAAALARHDGNIARTARALGLHRQSLQKLLARRALR